MNEGADFLFSVVWGLLGLALLTLAVVTIIWLIRHMTAAQNQQRQPVPDPAIEELRHRFASGQIDQDEFQRRREQLREQ